MYKGKLFLCVEFLNKKQGKHVGKRGNGREITHRQDAFGGGARDDDSRISKCQGEEAAATSVEYFAFPYANFNPSLLDMMKSFEEEEEEEDEKCS